MVVDTSIFIEFLRAKDKSITQYANIPFGTAIFVSAMTIYELFRGATDSNKDFHLRTMLRTVNVLDVSNEIAEKAGLIHKNLSKKGITIDTVDIVIGATAVSHNMSVLTLNTKHFSHIEGLMIV